MNDMEIACFLSVARTGSFTVSARELSSTQQAVSRNIQALEKELGFALLNRSGPSVTLTWAGERFMQWRIEHDAQLAALERQSSRMSAGADELYIAWNDWTGCPPGLEEDLADFRRSYPGVELHTRQGAAEEVVDMLTDGNADIAILPEHSTHNLRGLIVSPPFASLPLYVITRDADTAPTLAHLTNVRHLASAMGDMNDEAVLHRIRMFCAESGVAPKQVDIMPNARSIYTQLLCGGCYTIGPEPPAAASLHRWPLPGPGLRLVFVTPQGRLNPWVSLFENYVRQRRSAS